MTHAADRWARIHRERAARRKAKRTQPGDRVVPRQEPVLPLLSGVTGRAIAPASLSDDLVTVSVVQDGASVEALERAVLSILRGEHSNVRVVVARDASTLPDSISTNVTGDPRVGVVEALPDLGPCFAHDAALRAFPTGLFAVSCGHGESCPTRFSRQVTAILQARADVVLSPVIDVAESGATSITQCSTHVHPLFAHHADHFGLFHAPALVRLGGYWAGFRTGFDTTITALLVLLGRVAVTREALYRRYAPLPVVDPQDKADLAALYDDVYRASQRSPLSGLQRYSEILRARRPARPTVASFLVREIQRACAPFSGAGARLR